MALMSPAFTIAIDGPSGSGKSSTAREVARQLGLGYLDTGAMYRGVAVACLRAGVGSGDTDAITAICTRVDLDVSTDPDRPLVRVDGDDVTEAIRAPEVSAWVSAVATIPACRAELVARQQAIIAGHRFVVEGRDITTVVAPLADVRVLLVADQAARLARRGAELGGSVDAAALRDQVLRRDRDDSTLVEFQQAAPGVTVVDSTELGLDEVVQRIVGLAEAAGVSR